MIVVVAEKIPLAVEGEANGVAQAAGNDLKAGPVGMNAKDAADAGVFDFLARGGEPSPVAPMVGTIAEVAVSPKRIAAGEIQIALGAPVHVVQALMDVAERDAPDEPLLASSRFVS